MRKKIESHVGTSRLPPLHCRLSIVIRESSVAVVLIACRFLVDPFKYPGDFVESKTTFESEHWGIWFENSTTLSHGIRVCLESKTNLLLFIQYQSVENIEDC